MKPFICTVFGTGYHKPSLSLAAAAAWLITFSICRWPTDELAAPASTATEEPASWDDILHTCSRGASVHAQTGLNSLRLY